MLGRRPQKRDKTIALLREGETSSVIMANKAHTSVAYVSVVKNHQESTGPRGTPGQ